MQGQPVITADQAVEGDVVLAPDGEVYECAGGGQWMSMQLVVTESGPLWSPPGQLKLIAREARTG